jgi:flagellar hook-length control protein FliK
MPIHDLLTNLQVSPGLSPASTDDAGAKRDSYDPADGSEYRDRLAKSINSPSKNSEPTSVADGGATRSKPDAPAADQDKPPSKPTKKSASRSEAPELQTSAGTPPESTASPSSGATPTESSESESIIVEQKPADSDASLESEFDAAAMALLTITAAAPVNAAINLEIPSAPQGVQELLGSTAVEPAGTLVPDVSMTEAEPPIPPAGLVESFALPGTTSTSISTAAPTEPIEQQGQQQVSQPTAHVEFQSVVSAQATLDAAPPEVTAVSQTPQVAADAATSVPAETAEATDEGKSTSQSAQLERSNAAQTTSIVAAAATQSSDQSRANDEREKERARENEAHTRATVAKGSLEQSSGQDESSDGEDSNSIRPSQNSPKSSSGSALPSIVDIITTELIVDEGQPTIEVTDANAKDQASDSLSNPLANSAPAPSRPHSTTATTNTAAVGKITNQQAQQLVDRVSNALHQSAQSGQSLKVRLSPPELGVLQIEVMQRDGVLSARLEAQTASAHQTLVDNLSSLREALAQSGTVVERIEVQIVQNRRSDSPSDQTDRREQNAEQQNPQQQHRRDDGQPNKKEKREPHTRKGVRSMDQLDIQI